MLEYLHLKNVGPTPEMEMALASRLNLITGDNGLGKSFLLDVAWWALTRRWPHDINPKLTSGYAARPANVKEDASIEFRLTSERSYLSEYVPRDESWVGKAGRPFKSGLVVYAHADGGFSIWDPARNYWKKKGSIDVQDRLPGYIFSAREVWDGLEVDVDGKPTTVCNGLIRDWASWIREKGDNAAQMSAVMSNLAPEGESLVPGPLMRLSVNDARDIPSIRTAYAEAVPILYASAGIRRIVGLAYMLLWAWIEHDLAARLLGEERTSQVVVLFDEIESHLHPRWQRSILKSVLHIADMLQLKSAIQLIAATHSPLILASAEPLFDSRTDAWFDLDLERRDTSSEVVLRRREFVRRGDVSNWLTSEAFDLKEPRSIEAEEVIVKARELLRRKENPTVTEAQEVDALLHRAALPDIDPFWVRWGAFLERLGANR